MNCQPDAEELMNQKIAEAASGFGPVPTRAPCEDCAKYLTRIEEAESQVRRAVSDWNFWGSMSARNVKKCMLELCDYIRAGTYRRT